MREAAGRWHNFSHGCRAHPAISVKIPPRIGDGKSLPRSRTISFCRMAAPTTGGVRAHRVSNGDPVHFWRCGPQTGETAISYRIYRSRRGCWRGIDERRHRCPVMSALRWPARHGGPQACIDSFLFGSSRFCFNRIRETNKRRLAR